uniref:Uncharacterized protein n=1 Tax=Physcomitrium patens TaxID=3218 RepID=A0A2K1JE73_PHYPA|nr:hypothetical protein PHYPA_020117 [Physcomitrium patens]
MGPLELPHCHTFLYQVLILFWELTASHFSGEPCQIIRVVESKRKRTIRGRGMENW